MSDNTSPQSPSRRHFVGVAAATVAAGSLSQLAFAETNPAITQVAQPAGGDKTAIRPLRVHVPESQLIDLRRASKRHGGLNGRRSPMTRKACRSR